MDRRAFLSTLALLAGPSGGNAQEPRKVPRIGFLGPRTRADAAPYLDAFLLGLREIGWVEGQNIFIEYRWAEGRSERLPDLAAELVRLKVDVILAGPTAAAVAAKKATSAIPIVTTSAGDPGVGLVASLARPGRNVTGLSFSVAMATFGKGLELLKEAVPKVRRVAVLSNPTNPAHAVAIKEVAARSVGVQLQLLGARGPDELDSAFVAMARERAGALLVMADSNFGFHRTHLRDLAAQARLPAMYGLREHAEVGGLMSYGADQRDSFRRAATYVDKNPEGRQARRPSDRAADEVRVGDQPQDRHGAWIDNPALAAAARRPGHCE